MVRHPEALAILQEADGVRQLATYRFRSRRTSSYLVSHGLGFVRHLDILPTVLARADAKEDICFAVVLWGGISACTAAVKTYQQLLVVRVFLGVSEAVFFPGVVYYLSAW